MNDLPSLSQHDGADRRRTNTENRRDCDLGHLHCGQLPDCVSIFLRQFGLNASLAVARSSLSDHICDIISLPSKEKMIRTNTSRNVTGVQNRQPFRNRTVMDLPRETMRASTLTSPTAQSDFAMTERSRVSRPHPTAIRLFNIFPETFGDWTARWSVLMAGDIPTREPLHLVASTTCRGRNRSEFSAATAAQTRRVRVLRIRKEIWGILGEHSGRLLYRLIGVPRTGRLQSRRCLSRAFSPFIIAEKSAVMGFLGGTR